MTPQSDKEPAVRHYLPTIEELAALARFHLNTIYGNDVDMWFYEQYAGSWHRQSMYARSRLNEIREFIGDSEYEKAVAPVHEEWKKRESAP